MADITTISAFITSVRNAVEIAKALKEAEHSFEKAEAKLKIAELISALADSKIQAAEIQDLLQEKDKRIAELEEALKLKASLKRSNDAYFEVGSDGKITGAPYCSHCWEVSYKAIHLHRDHRGHWQCPNCKNEYA